LGYIVTMRDYQLITEIIQTSARIPETKIVERRIDEKLKKTLDVAKPLKVITGLRRSGKSFALKKIYHDLIARNIPPKNILFINFELDLAHPINDLASLRETFDTFIAHADEDKPVYLFLDEIQNIDRWEKFVRTLYDSADYHIYVTGSNSNLLSGEFSTVLGGRILQYEIQPFSYREFLAFHDALYETPFEKASLKSNLIRLQDLYLHFGGLVETFLLEDEEKRSYRTSLIEKIIIKDILERHTLENAGVLRDLILYLEKNVCSIANYTKIAEATPVSDVTIEKYLTYLMDTYMLYELPKFYWKTKEIFSVQKKYYFVDNLFIHKAPEGPKLENLVFQQLIRGPQAEIYFGRKDRGKEINFVVKHDDDYDLIQVCYELNEDNIKREVGNLIKARKNLGDMHKYLLLYDHLKVNEEKIPREIEHLNVWDWLLDKDT